MMETLVVQCDAVGRRTNATHKTHSTRWANAQHAMRDVYDVFECEYGCLVVPHRVVPGIVRIRS